MITTSTTSATVIETDNGEEDATKSSTYSKISDSSLFYEPEEGYKGSKENYYGTWEANWNEGSLSSPSGSDEYIIIEENDSTYIYLVCEDGKFKSDSQKGTWTYEESSNKMTLSAGYWYSGSGTTYDQSSDWQSANGGYGLYVETISTASASVINWWNGGSESKGTYIKQK